MSQGLPSIILVPVCLSGMTLWWNRSSCAAAKREKPRVAIVSHTSGEVNPLS